MSQRILELASTDGLLLSPTASRRNMLQPKESSILFPAPPKLNPTKAKEQKGTLWWNRESLKLGSFKLFRTLQFHISRFLAEIPHWLYLAQPCVVPTCPVLSLSHVRRVSGLHLFFPDQPPASSYLVDHFCSSAGDKIRRQQKPSLPLFPPRSFSTPLLPSNLSFHCLT